MNTIFLSLVIILFLGVKSCTSVSCTSCKSSIHINLTTDTTLNTDGCSVQEAELCSLILRIDYAYPNDSYAIIDGGGEGILILTNGEPQVSEMAFIWFTEVRLQRMAQIICFSQSACGLDTLKEIYRDKFRLFDYETIQSRLANQLYTSTPTTDLTCADPSDASVPCPNGFCRSIFDGKGLVSYSSCVKKGSAPIQYGLQATTMTMLDFGGDQTTLMFTCNIPMCNSKENTQKVLQQLIAAQVIPQPVTTTTVVVPTTTTTVVVPTTKI